MPCRIDKYLWCVRLSKTRSVATELINKGKVRINNVSVKPSREVKQGDVIQIQRNLAFFSYKVLDVISNRVGAPLVKDYLLDVTPKEEIEKFLEHKAHQDVYRKYGTGKPSKKDRRDIGDYLSWDEDFLEDQESE